MQKRYVIWSRGMWVASLDRQGDPLMTPRRARALVYTRSTAARKLEALSQNFPALVFGLEEAPVSHLKRKALA
ncbi:hypothetical protein AZ34_10340 [Hylemonella gracilis str. Niagara R]|uniref:Uncharacterized protein n=1 Tax=Hylemonella gracilis str. Niagara R TaxID=1458275 RepID=A0A016XMQ6_9BURK|nr:hypothetical protein [Hylemonella gracilis]EYC52867.1 hypothetical protein AZ34_10340 [Hylemonella gracilis str. Niagara R]